MSKQALRLSPWCKSILFCPMSKKECKQRIGLDIGLDEKAVEQGESFFLGRTAEEPIKVYRDVYMTVA